MTIDVINYGNNIKLNISKMDSDELWGLRYVPTINEFKWARFRKSSTEIIC